MDSDPESNRCMIWIHTTVHFICRPVFPESLNCTFITNVRYINCFCWVECTARWDSNFIWLVRNVKKNLKNRNKEMEIILHNLIAIPEDEKCLRKVRKSYVKSNKQQETNK